MKKHLPIILLLACAAAFVLGVVQLFKLRFEAGDIYPEYSSLRADPLGTMAFYESLEKLPSLAVRRDHSPANKLPEARNTVYLHLAARTLDWDSLPKDLWKEIDGFLLNGGRLAITFFPETARPFRFLADLDDDSDKSKRKKSNDDKDTKSSPPGKKDKKPKRKRFGNREPASDSVKKHWGVEFTHLKLNIGDDGNTYEPTQVFNPTTQPLPESLDWHSAVIFTNLDKAWHTVYARGTNPVVIERKFGAGTVVMATDSYFLSNEAMREDRHADLLAWLVGSNKHVVFDEGHLGILESASVAALIRKYRLHGLVAGLIVLAALFIWKNSVSLVPPYAEQGAHNYVAGKDATAGFVNLIRRNIPARDLLAVCFAEWTKTLSQGRYYNSAAVSQARALIEAEQKRPRGERDSAKTYQQVCDILKSRRLRTADSAKASLPSEQKTQSPT